MYEAIQQVTSSRLAALRATFVPAGVDGILITHPINRRWLSGFTGSAGQLLITADRAWLITDFRYWEQAERQAPAFELVRHRREEGWAQIWKTAGITRVGVEAGHMTLAEHARLASEFAAFGALVPLRDTVEQLRVVKDAVERETIGRAAAITDRVMARVPALARPGMTEKALAWALEKALRDEGADGPAFPIIVATGANSALPHHRPNDTPLRVGDAIVVDMGARVDGYRSDLTRTFHLGTAPGGRFQAVYAAVAAAQRAALAALRAGMTGQAADSVARDALASAGYGDYFGHSLGHSLGLEIHEQPRLSQANEAALPAGCIMTVEPGVYIPGWGGVRIEDLVWLALDGATRLSHCPQTPLIEV